MTFTVGALLLGQSLGLTKHRFVYIAEKALKSVSIAGTFNDWNKDATPMQSSRDGKTWTKELELKYGRHQYKFVRNGEEWITDPKAAKNEDDGNGNTNSILVLNPPDFLPKAARGDGNITASAIEHQPNLPYFNIDGNTFSVTLRTRKDDVSSVGLKVNGISIPTTIRYSDDLFEYHRGEFKWKLNEDLSYAFTVKDGAKTLLLPNLKQTIKASSFKPFVVPKWVQGSVIYQIFPDRFENGDIRNDPAGMMPWDGEPTYGNRFGGDIAGVKKRIGYLKDLGVGAVYFNPIFKSPSNHRYEADDYFSVDPEFGTVQEFKSLNSDLATNGIFTILDFAFNHTSVRTAEFQDLAKNGEASPYKNWYFPKSFPVKPGDPATYEAWYGYASMPKLNTVNPATTEFLLKVCRFWLDDIGIKGLRLDVANEVDMNFWRKMRPFVKKDKADTWILGEIWGDGNPWLKGDQFDSVMNYQFREAALRFIAKGTSDGVQFAKDLTRVDNSYPSQVSRNMMNLLSSHDTPRFITECGGDKNLAKLGAAIQFTWIGEPSIYYGEELGMEGGKDPMNRRGMEWSKATQDNDMLSFYKKLIRVRKQTDAFATGSAQFLNSDKDTGAYTRIGAKDMAIVAFNRSDKPATISLQLPAGLQTKASRGLFDAFTGTAYAAPGRPIQLNVKPKSFAILTTNSISNSSLSQRSGSTSLKRDSVQRRANLTTRSQTIK